MMHCMVSRRDLPGRRKSRPVNESLNAGLATLIADHQGQAIKRQQMPDSPPFEGSRGTECPNFSGSERGLPHCGGMRNAIVDREKEEEKLGTGYDEDSSFGSLIGPLQRVCMGSRKQYSPYPKVSDVREARRASLDRNDVKVLREISLEPASASSLSFHCKGQHKDFSDETTEKFAYISLDGRLINSELATSATSIGGALGEKEAQAWEDFEPMHRVLIVAVSAAAAAAAKHKNSREINRLHKTVTDRENDLVQIRQQLSDLWKQSNTNQENLLARTEHPIALASNHTDPDFGNPKTPPRRDSKLQMHDKETECPDILRTQQQPCRAQSAGNLKYCSDSMDEDLKPSRDPPVNKDIVFMETSSRVDAALGAGKGLPTGESICQAAEIKEEAKWYVNPMVETSDQYFDMCTPQRGNPMFSMCTPAVRGSLEWMRTSFTDMRSSDTSRLPSLAEFLGDSPVQGVVKQPSDNSKSPKVEDNEMRASRARCASVIIEFQKQVKTVLDKEDQDLVAALDVSVEKARGHIVSLQAARTSLWQTQMPKALAALGISPSEYEHHLLPDGKGTPRKSFAPLNLSKAEEDTHAWEQWLEANTGATMPKLSSDQNTVGVQCGSQSTSSCFPVLKHHSTFNASKHSSDVEVEVLSQRKSGDFLSEDKLAVTTLMHPCDGESGKAAKMATHSTKRGLGFPENSAEFIAEQLLGELDKAAAKVADMESQMKSLKQYAEESDAKRKHNESKLAGSLEEDLQNQAKAHVEIAALTRQLRSKEIELESLKRSQKTQKSKDDEERNPLCPLQAPKGYGTIYWERATTSGKTKIFMFTESFKSRRNRKEKEPKVMLMAKSKEIAELKEDSIRHNRELDDITAAVQADQTASADRIKTLEELCRQRNSSISEMKQEILALEVKAHGARTFQSPAMLRGRRSFMPFATSSPIDEVAGLNVSLADHSKERTLSWQTHSPPYSPKIDIGSLDQHLENLQVEPSSEKDHLSSISSLSSEDVIDEGRLDYAYGCDQESSRDLLSPPPSTIGDDFLELENSLKALSVDEITPTGSEELEEYIPVEVTRSETRKDEPPAANQNAINLASTKLKTISSDVCRTSTSSISSIPGPIRVRASVTFTSANLSKKASGVRHTGGKLMSGDKKVKNRDFKGPRTSLSSLPVLGSVAPNTPVTARRTSSVDLKEGGISTLVGSGGSLGSETKENSKRRRWV